MAKLGRPKLKADERRGANLQIRFRAAEVRAMRAVVRAKGLTLTSFIRGVSLKAAGIDPTKTGGDD